MTDPLDNPIWHALSGPHAAHAIGTAGALRYPRDVGWFCAVPDPATTGIGALSGITSPGDIVVVFTTSAVPTPRGWEQVFSGQFVQMVCTRVNPSTAHANTNLIELGDPDVDEMLALVKLTEPGPFLARSNILGRYVGVRHDARLVAMAGERMRIDGATEVSAVCTHPDARGRGYAQQLVAEVASHITARGERAFLHVAVDNLGAQRVYERVGFTPRAVITTQVFRAPASA